ncbi:M23 family metallopeptidase [Lutibacter sp. B1]|nr:M23 family metallopeptidase [Lutibacter sp. B1]NLP58720.1 M23 family metallopeptidase [Lutibacter sp. B1]
MCCYFAVYSQGETSSNNLYPTNYFRKPLDIPILLSGTFGELRSNHFHAGLDIKTQQREGFYVYTAAEGYVSRIKVSLWGYGKAIYITHPNGYTTVYAHLKKFNKRIEEYVKNTQYSKENYEIEVFPSANELPVSKNEVIAYTGSTGGFVGPHLHFEIRDSKTEKPINPLFFGIDVNDSKPPTINTLIGYSFGDSSHINQIGKPTQIPLKKLANGDLLANKTVAYGKIGFGINAYDQLDGAYNKNGLYSLEMFVNAEKVHEFKATTFSFYETRYINLLIDYERYGNLNQRIQKCFIEPLNKLSMYNNSIDNGYLTIKDSLNYNVEIIAKDYKGNQQKIIIPVIGKKDSILVKDKILKTPYPIKYNVFQKYAENGVTVTFPAFTFYNDFYLDFKVADSIAHIHTPTLPLHKKFTIAFDVSKYTEKEQKHLYIASINKKGKTSYQTTVKKDNTFYTSTKNLGNYTLLFDNKEPTINLHNFKNEQWVTNFSTLRVKIFDNESGIKSFRGEIDGEWILMEYNIKTNTLNYNLSDKSFSEAKHNLKVIVTDNVGNTSTLNATFYRKK